MESVNRISLVSTSGREDMVSTVGRDETVIREYIGDQEDEDKRLDQLNLWK
jgi:hypothetical protein